MVLHGELGALQANRRIGLLLSEKGEMNQAEKHFVLAEQAKADASKSSLGALTGACRLADAVVGDTA